MYIVLTEHSRDYCLEYNVSKKKKKKKKSGKGIPEMRVIAQRWKAGCNIYFQKDNLAGLLMLYRNILICKQ
jgi:hypothetical protein